MSIAKVVVIAWTVVLVSSASLAAETAGVTLRADRVATEAAPLKAGDHRASPQRARNLVHGSPVGWTVVRQAAAPTLMVNVAYRRHAICNCRRGRHYVRGAWRIRRWRPHPHFIRRAAPNAPRLSGRAFTADRLVQFRPR